VCVGVKRLEYQILIPWSESVLKCGYELTLSWTRGTGSANYGLWRLRVVYWARLSHQHPQTGSSLRVEGHVVRYGNKGEPDDDDDDYDCDDDDDDDYDYDDITNINWYLVFKMSSHPPIAWVPGFCPVSKAVGACEFNHLPSSSVEVKNVWRYTSGPFICLHDMDRAISTLYPFFHSSLLWSVKSRSSAEDKMLGKLF
jgi:hypothetical protein